MKKQRTVSQVLAVLLAILALAACAPKELTAQEIVQKMADNSENLKTGHMDMTLNLSAAGQSISGNSLGVFENPDKSYMVMELLGAHVEVLTLSPTEIYTRTNTSDAWQSAPADATGQFGGVTDITRNPQKLLSLYQNLQLLGTETIDGTECYHLSFELDLLEVMEATGVNMESMQGASYKGLAQVESWVGTQDFFGRRVSQKFTLVAEGQEVDVESIVNVTQINQPVEIPTP
jgi:outer membrane lipoprotein-sorting protein